MDSTRRGFLKVAVTAAAAPLVGVAAVNVPASVPSAVVTQLPVQHRGNYIDLVDKLATTKLERVIRTNAADFVRQCFSNTLPWTADNIRSVIENNYDLYDAYAMLKEFPQEGLPLEFLSEEVLAYAYGSLDTPLDEVPAVIEARKLRAILEPLCDDTTTFADI